MTEVEELNNEFECMLSELECSFPSLNFREKSIATEWIKKLKKSNATIDELKLRVDFIEYFLSTVGCVFRSEPFNKIPPPNSTLLSLRYLLPPDRKGRSMDASPEEQKREYINEMFDVVNDSETFFAEQPVPRDGTFFLMTLTPDICGEE